LNQNEKYIVLKEEVWGGDALSGGIGESRRIKAPMRNLQKTALRSIRPKDVMTSLVSLLTSHRGIILQVLAKENNVCIGIMPVELSSEKLMRYREFCI
jgi:hypothetical protein